MKTATVLKALMVSALVLGFIGASLASCGCASAGKDVCGGGCTATVVPAPRPHPPPRPVSLVRKYVTVIEHPAEETCYQPAPRPAPRPAPVCSSCGSYSSCGCNAAPEPIVYQPARRIVVQPKYETVCKSCYRPASSCGCA